MRIFEITVMFKTSAGCCYIDVYTLEVTYNIYYAMHPRTVVSSMIGQQRAVMIKDQPVLWSPK